MPGGRFAPPPPVSRVAMGGIAFLVTAVFALAWAGLGTLHNLTARGEAVSILSAELQRPTQDALFVALQNEPHEPRLTFSKDLVVFDIPKPPGVGAELASELAGQQAATLYDHGFPKDPGYDRTQTRLPRGLLVLFTAARHKQLALSAKAALIGALAGMFICAFIATGAARFGLPGAAVGLGWLMLQYHLLLSRFWFERNMTNGLLFRGGLRVAAFEPGRRVLFVAVALLVAGFVYSALLGGTKTVVQERRRRETKKAANGEKPDEGGQVAANESDVAGPPAEPPSEPPAEPPSEPPAEPGPPPEATAEEVSS
jgi:hypothetical protein